MPKIIKLFTNIPNFNATVMIRLLIKEIPILHNVTGISSSVFYVVIRHPIALSIFAFQLPLNYEDYFSILKSSSYTGYNNILAV